MQPLQSDFKKRSLELRRLQSKMRQLEKSLDSARKLPQDSVRMTGSGETAQEAKKRKKSKRKDQTGFKPLRIENSSGSERGVVLKSTDSNLIGSGQPTFGNSSSAGSEGMLMGSSNPHGPIAIEDPHLAVMANSDSGISAQDEVTVEAPEPVETPSNPERFTQAMLGSSSEPTIETAPTAEEVVEQVEDTVKETLGDGVTAVNQQIEDTTQQVKELQAKTRASQAAIAEEAPKFSAELAVLLEKYQAATNRTYQESLQLEINALLDSTSEALKPQIDKVREQTQGLYEKTAAAWEARAAAMGMKKPDAQQLSKEQRERRKMTGTGKQHLEQQYRDRANQGRLADQLRTTSDGKRDLVSELNKRGALN